MLEIIALWLGYILIIVICLFFIGLLLMLIYHLYDYYLKKLLGWKELELRKDLFYFIKHKKEIREYIKNKNIK